MIEVSLRHRWGGGPALAIDFVAPDGATALFGPSGAGKSSVVGVIAGLLAAQAARVVVDGEVLTDTGQGIFVPVEKRRLGLVFQDARLFPHLSVMQNLDYGRRMNRLMRDEAAEDRVIAMLDIGHLRDRRIGKLSGGEAQRVALGRALLSRPRLLLLDEPLGALDETRKAEILPYLIRLRDEAKIPMVYVSHDAEEMRKLATHVALFSRGRITDFGEVAILPKRAEG